MLQQRDQALRERLDDRDLQREPRVFDAGRKGSAVAQQVAGTVRKLVDAVKQAGGRALLAQVRRQSRRGREGIERNVDAIEIAVILAAILQVIDDLQRRAEGIIGGPGGPALPVHVEHEASDRHGGVGAIADQIVPVAVAQLGHVHAECGEQILRMARREMTCSELRAQGDGDGVIAVPAEQCRLEPVEQRKLVLRGQRRMVRDIVGGADEFVECENRLAMTRMNQPRCHREIFVPMALARTRFDRSDHHRSDTLACTRPFHAPPRPRTYW